MHEAILINVLNTQMNSQGKICTEEEEEGLVSLPVSMQLTFGNRGNSHMTYIGHTCQRLTSKPHGFDRQ